MAVGDRGEGHSTLAGTGAVVAEGAAEARQWVAGVFQLQGLAADLAALERHGAGLVSAAEACARSGADTVDDVGRVAASLRLLHALVSSSIAPPLRLGHLEAREPQHATVYGA
jgi:hypothetical protein